MSIFEAIRILKIALEFAMEDSEERRRSTERDDRARNSVLMMTEMHVDPITGTNWPNPRRSDDTFAS